MTFARLLRQLQQTHYPDSAKTFATALGIHHSRIYRALQHGGDPFDVRGCITLAKVTGADLLVILRAAGKADIADGLRDLLGPTLQSATPARQRLIDVCDRLTEEQIRYVTITLEVLVEGRTDGPAATPPLKRTRRRPRTVATNGNDGDAE